MIAIVCHFVDRTIPFNLVMVKCCADMPRYQHPNQPPAHDFFVQKIHGHFKFLEVQSQGR